MLKFNYQSNYELQKKYLEFHLFKNKKMHYKQILVVILIISFFIFALIRKEIIVTIASLIVLIITNVMFFLALNKIYKDNLYNLSFNKESKLEITLDITKMQVKRLETSEEIDVDLEKIYRIFDWKDYMFIYLTKSQAICLAKSQLMCGDISLYLKELLKSEMAIKYRRVGRN